VGAIVDRHDRRTVLAVADVVNCCLQALAVAWLLADSRPSLHVLCGFVLAVKSVSIFSKLATNAALPRLVPPDRLLDAVSFNAATGTLMPIAAFGASALVLGAAFRVSPTTGYVLTFGFNSVTFLISALLLLRLPRIVPEGAADRAIDWRSVREGLLFLPRRPFLMQATALCAGVAFCMCALQTPDVVAAQDRFAGSPALLAWLELSSCAGGLMGALLAMRFRPTRPGICFSTFLLLTGACFVAMGHVHSIWLFSLLKLGTGLFLSLGVVPLDTAFQRAIPDPYRGRVNGADEMLASWAGIAGALASGWIMTRYRLEGGYVFIGAVLASIALAGWMAGATRRSRLGADPPEDSPVEQAATSG
jgi:hypothetical protein